MTNYAVQIYLVGNDGKPQPKFKAFRISTNDVDEANSRVLQEVLKRQLPPVRTMNFGPGKDGDKVIHVYCQHTQLKADVVPGLDEWKRPPRT